MKKIILLSSIILIILIFVVIFVLPSHHRKVSDFSVFPCEMNRADTVEIETGQENFVLSRVSGDWRLESPVKETLDWGAYKAFGAFMASKVFVDERREMSAEEKAMFSKPVPTYVAFKQGDKRLCRFELGQGIKLGSVDSERRWVFMDGELYRTFIPLMDYGQLLEQPLAGWRMRALAQLTTSTIESIKIWSDIEEYQIERKAGDEARKVQDWRMVYGRQEGRELDVSNFELDESRVATIIDLVTPFVVDDWVDGASPQDKEQISYGGYIEVRAKGTTYRFEIGSEVDTSKDSLYSWLGKGARYIRLGGDDRLGIVRLERLNGLYPSLDEMRTKRVWKLDSTQMSSLEVQVGEACVRYEPGENASDGWYGGACDLGEVAAGEEKRAIRPEELGNYVKVLMSLQASRYGTREERGEEISGIEIRIYEGLENRLSKTLRMGETHSGVYRLCQIEMFEPGTSKNSVRGPVFVIPEQIARYLMSDLRN